MMQYRQHRRKVAVGIGILFGISASLFAMIPASHPVEASIFVTDKLNIEQAIKTAVQTAKILNEEQKQVLMMILNAKKLDVRELGQYEIAHELQREKVWDEKGRYTGLGGIFGTVHKNKDGSITFGSDSPFYMDANGQIQYDSSKVQYQLDKVWKTKLGDLSAVLNVDGTSILNGDWQGAITMHTTVTESNKDAALSAANSEANTTQLADATQKALQDSNNAEGELQAIQSGNQLTALTNQSLINLMGTYNKAVQAQAARYEAENLQRAKIEANEHHNGEKLTKQGQEILLEVNATGR